MTTRRNILTMLGLVSPGMAFLTTEALTQSDLEDKGIPGVVMPSKATHDKAVQMLEQFVAAAKQERVQIVGFGLKSDASINEASFLDHLMTIRFEVIDENGRPM